MPGKYPLNQSPLYRLRNRKKLAELLGIDRSALEALSNERKYRRYELKIPGKKSRDIQDPNKALKKAQAKIASWLGKILAPGYLHSGYKGTSYISNASQHLDMSIPTFKIDVKKFFANADARRVETLFLRRFQCGSDVAAIMCKLNTVDGHIPTGGSSSTMMSFWAYADMFDEVNELVASHGVKMTLCVDDMTFSGAGATKSLRFEVEKVIKRYGLSPHKRHHTKPGQAKIITGVAVTGRGIRLPNKRRKLLHQAHQELDAETALPVKFKKAQELMGRATEAAQVESRFERDVARAAAMLKEVTEAVRKAGYEIEHGKIKVKSWKP
jgi:RNA-directed DNA polymerase